MPEDLIKLFAESPFALALAYGVYRLAPILKTYCDQQIAQLKVLAEAVGALGTRVDEVEKKVDGRLDRVEKKIDQIAEEQQHVAH